MASLFSKIISGEIPCYKILENKNFIAFLDINPIAKGHVLVVPKKEVDDMFDLDLETFSELHLFSKIIAHAIKIAIPCNRIGTCVIGLEVPHAHIHLVPINTSHDMNFKNPTLSLSKEEMNEIADRIKTHLPK